MYFIILNSSHTSRSQSAALISANNQPQNITTTSNRNYLNVSPDKTLVYQNPNRNPNDLCIIIVFNISLSHVQ